MLSATYRSLLSLLLKPGLDEFQRLLIQSLARVVREGCPDRYPGNVIIINKSHKDLLNILPFAKIGKDVCFVEK